MQVFCLRILPFLFFPRSPSSYSHEHISIRTGKKPHRNESSVKWQLRLMILWSVRAESGAPWYAEAGWGRTWVPEKQWIHDMSSRWGLGGMRWCWRRNIVNFSFHDEFFQSLHICQFQWLYYVFLCSFLQAPEQLTYTRNLLGLTNGHSRAFMFGWIMNVYDVSWESQTREIHTNFTMRDRQLVWIVLISDKVKTGW